jgi:ssRNA-specific RNase YbeY (16S rRNA maturation enzyme)
MLPTASAASNRSVTVSENFRKSAVPTDVLSLPNQVIGIIAEKKKK